MTSIINQLVSHVLDTPFEAFSQEVIAAAKDRLIDALGCTVSGSGGSGNEALMATLMAWGGASQATVLGTGQKLPLPHAPLILRCAGLSRKASTKARWWDTFPALRSLQRSALASS